MIKLKENDDKTFQFIISKDEFFFGIYMDTNKKGDIAICNGKDVYVALKNEKYKLKKVINLPWEIKDGKEVDTKGKQRNDA